MLTTAPSSYTGAFITLEGGEGTGKSTQIKMLQSALTDAGLSVVTTREPGGTPQAEKIRQLALHEDSGDFDPMTEVLLMFAARREHVVHKIWPELAKGSWVISDRFADSTRAMQGYGHGIPQDMIEDIYQAVIGDFHPDLTFILDIDPEIGLKRSMKHLSETTDAVEAKESRFEKMDLGFHQRLRQGFLNVAKTYADRCVVIDAAQTVDAIHQQMIDVVTSRFNLTLKAVQNG